MDFNYLIIFKKVADCGSFSGAAAQLGILKSSVSQKITQLEQDLGVRLLQRTTRQVNLTEVGEKVYDSVERIIAEAEDIRSLVGNVGERPSGLLRITAPNDFGAYIIDRVLQPFFALNPGVEVEMDLSNRFVDLIGEGFDLAIRASSEPLKESSLVARSLLTTSARLYASPAWIARHGHPRHIDALQGVPAIVFAAHAQRRAPSWTLTREPGESVAIPVHAVFRTNDFLAIKRACLRGLGIALLPEIICLEEVDRKDLVPILADWGAERAQYSLVYPSRRYLPAKTKVFMEFLQDMTGQDHRRCSTSP